MSGALLLAMDGADLLTKDATYLSAPHREFE